MTSKAAAIRTLVSAMGEQATCPGCGRAVWLINRRRREDEGCEAIKGGKYPHDDTGLRHDCAKARNA